MLESKVYLALLIVWISLNLIVFLIEIFTGKGIKKGLKSLLTRILLIEKLVDKKNEKVIEDDKPLIPVDDIDCKLAQFSNKCHTEVTAKDYDELVEYFKSLSVYFGKGEDNDKSTT